MAVGGVHTSGGEEGESERAHNHAQSPQLSSHSGNSRRQRPYIKELPADPAALSALWPEVETWLMGSLLKRGVDHATARDACQEVALRLLTKGKQFESADHFYRWVNKVAHNTVSKWIRKDHRLSAEDPPERTTPDVAVSLEHRVELAAVIEALAGLSDADQQAISTALRLEERGQTKRERDRVSLQLLRARKRLRERLDGWLAGIPWWRFRWPTDATPLAAGSNAAVTVVALSASVLSAWWGPHQQRTHPEVQPISVISDRRDASPSVHPPGQRASSSARIRERNTRQASGPLDEHRLVVVPPADAPGTTEAGTKPRDTSDDSLLCWGNVPHLPDSCVSHPLRRDGRWITPQP